MKQLLDTFGRWGFTGLLVALLAISGFLIFFNLVGAPLFVQVLQKIVGVIGVYLAIFIGKQACFADLFPTSVTRFFAYMREHANTENNTHGAPLLGLVRVRNESLLLRAARPFYT